MNKKIFIYNVRLLRVSQELTVSQMADILAISPERIYSIEKNPNSRIYDYEVQQIANFFDVDPTIISTTKATVVFKMQQNGKEKGS